MGPYLQMQNYVDIGTIYIAAQNSSTREVPRPCSRGGGRGGVHLVGTLFIVINCYPKFAFDFSQIIWYNIMI